MRTLYESGENRVGGATAEGSWNGQLDGLNGKLDGWLDRLDGKLDGRLDSRMSAPSLLCVCYVRVTQACARQHLQAQGGPQHRHDHQ